MKRNLWFLGTSVAALFLSLGSIGPAQAQAKDNIKMEEQQCREHLQALGEAIDLYSIYNEGKLPSRLSDLYKFGPDLEVFSCPASGKHITEEARIDELTDYELVARPPADGRMPIFKEKSGYHDGSSLVFYSDRTIDKVKVAPPGPAEPPELAAGVSQLQAGKYAAALKLFDEAVKRAPGSTQALRYRGLARLWTNDLKGALADFRAAADQGKDAEACRLRATLELIAGDPKAGKAEAERLLKLQPRDADSLILAGQAALWTNNMPGASEPLKQAKGLSSAKAQKLYEEANRFLAARVPKMAILDYMTAVYMNPEMDMAYYGLGLACAQLGYRDRAMEAFDRYLKRDQTSQYAKEAKKELERLRQKPK